MSLKVVQFQDKNYQLGKDFNLSLLLCRLLNFLEKYYHMDKDFNLSLSSKGC